MAFTSPGTERAAQLTIKRRALQDAQKSGDAAAIKKANKDLAAELKRQGQQAPAVNINAAQFFENPQGNIYTDANGKPVDMSKQVTAFGQVNLTPKVVDFTATKAVGSPADTDKYVITESKGAKFLVEKGAALPVPMGIYVDPKDPSQYTVGPVTQVVDKVLADYQAQPNGILNLKRMLASKTIKALPKTKASNNNNVDDALRAALRKKISTDSVNIWSNYSSGGFIASQFPTFNEALTGGGYDTTTGVNVSMTPAAQAQAEVKNFIKGMVGLDLDPKLAASYAKALNKLEKSRPDKTTTTRDPLTGNTYQTSVKGGVTQEEKARLLYKVLGNVVKKTPYETLVKNGGKAIQDAADLTKYAAAFGYKITTKDAVDRIITADAAGQDINAEKEKIKQATIARYGHLAKAIEAGSTLKDIANQYIYYKSQLMETPAENITLDDPDIQAALDTNGKLMSTNDFQIRIRKNPLWGKTRNAKEEAATYVNNILSSWGRRA